MAYRIAFALIFIFLLIACGGGGGGGGSGDVQLEVPAKVDINAFPRKIDSGDRIYVSILVKEVSPLGIALKLRFPSGLSYVSGSSFLLVGNDSADIGPTEIATSGSDSFLVYYFAEADFDPKGHGEVSLTLSGLSQVTKGDIEVDTDVDDPDVSNPLEFDVDNPLFDKQDAIRVQVQGQAASATPTVTPTPEA